MRKIFLSLLICVLFANPALAAMSDADFFELVRSGTLQEIQEAIRNGANVNARVQVGFTPLMIAASFNPDPEVIITLIDAGADVNAKCRNYNTALHNVPFFIPNPNPEMTIALIKAGADVNARNSCGDTPLHWEALFRSKPELIIALIEAGADASARSHRGYTPLHFSAGHPNSEARTIVALIAAGADVNAKNWGNWTPLHSASRASNPRVIKTLIEAGADVNARATVQITSWDDIGEVTPLMAAAEHNSNPEVITTLIEAGADINARNTNGQTALMSAASAMLFGYYTTTANPEAITMLLNHGADPTMRDGDGRRAIDFARENDLLRNTEALQKLAAATSASEPLFAPLIGTWGANIMGTETEIRTCIQ